MLNKKVKLILNSGLECNHTIPFRDESDFKAFVLKVAQSFVKLGTGKGWLILEGPYAWYFSDHIAALQFLDTVPEDGKEPIGFKLPKELE